VILELQGLEVFGRHGVLANEQREGQTFLFDLELEIAEPAADRVEETVDYREVAASVRSVSDRTRFELLEALAAAVADELLASFPVSRVRVRARKPHPWGVAAAWSAATVERTGHAASADGR
jgi:7,8-dihydroneopterin aldolase/epimerase/oxygenase